MNEWQHYCKYQIRKFYTHTHTYIYIEIMLFVYVLSEIDPYDNKEQNDDREMKEGKSISKHECCK